MRGLLYPLVKPAYCGYSYYRAVIDISENVKLMSTSLVGGAKCNDSVATGKVLCEQKVVDQNCSDKRARRDVWYDCDRSDAWESWGLDNRIAYVPMKDNKVLDIL